MRHRERLGPAPPKDQAVEERSGHRHGRSGERHVERAAARRHAPERGTEDAPPAPGELRGKVLGERRADRREIGPPVDHGDHRPLEPSRESRQVDEVEAGVGDAVEDHGPDALELARRFDQGGDPFRGVPSIDSEPPGRHGVEPVRRDDHDRDEARVAVSPSERSVLDGADAELALREGPPKSFSEVRPSAPSVQGPPGATPRCPRCGLTLSVPVGRSPSPPVFPCPRCGGPIVAVVDREPAPLYTWEVYPNLYPSAPVPRWNPYRWTPGIRALLLAALVVLAGLAGTLGAVGVLTATSRPIVVAGTVYVAGTNGSGPHPLPGALVTLVGEADQLRDTVTDAAGVFRFSAVEVGAFALNVSYPQLPPVQLDLFASPFYATGGVGHLAIVLGDGPAASSTLQVDSAFPDLESYLTSVGSAAVLLGIGALGAALAVRLCGRRAPGALVAAGGAGAAVAPVSCIVLGLVPTMPAVTVASVVAMALGSAAAGLAAAYRWMLGPFDTDAPG